MASYHASASLQLPLLVHVRVIGVQVAGFDHAVHVDVRHLLALVDPRTDDVRDVGVERLDALGVR